MTWRRHFFYTRESVRTTWKFRIGVLIGLVLATLLTRDLWVAQVARGLICTSDVRPSDAILVENFDPNYLLFERAEALEAAGIAPRIFVHVQASTDPTVPDPVSQGFAEVMARQARIRLWEAIPVGEVEPISLNAAAQIRDRLLHESIKSLIVVSPGFRSRRSALVYGTVLGKARIQVRCDPVFGGSSPKRWTETWHGIAVVAEEFLKLQYYRLYVLPSFSLARGSRT